MAMNNEKTRRRILYHYVDLFILIGLCILVAVFIYLIPNSSVRIFGGMLYIFYAPGYALFVALYPYRPIRGQQLWASVGLSIVITGLLSLVITYYLGTNLHTSFGILTIWIMVMLLIAGYRRYLTSRQEAFALTFNTSLTTWRQKIQSPQWLLLLLAQMAAVILLVLAAGRLLWVTTYTSPQFAEFYVLGDDRRAGNYPQQATIDKPIVIMLGVVNHGGDSIPYDLSVQLNEGGYSPLTSLILNESEKWESEVTLKPFKTSGRQKLTFVLQKPGEEFPYRTLHLWFDVKSP